MKRWIVAAILIFSLVVVVGMGAQERGQWVWGTGNESCGAWLEGQRTFRIHMDATFPVDVTTEVNEQRWRQHWVLGFMSGVTATGKVRLRKVDYKGIFAAMDKECEADPTQSTADAATRVAFKLIQN